MALGTKHSLAFLVLCILAGGASAIGLISLAMCVAHIGVLVTEITVCAPACALAMAPPFVPGLAFCLGCLGTMMNPFMFALILVECGFPA